MSAATVFHPNLCTQGIEKALARSITHLGCCATLGPFYSLFHDTALRTEFVNCGIDLIAAMAQVHSRKGEASGQLWSGGWRKGKLGGQEVFSREGSTGQGLRRSWVAQHRMVCIVGDTAWVRAELISPPLPSAWACC